MWRPSGTWLMPRFTISCGSLPSMRSPSNRISPARGRSIPEIVMSVVLLPAPFAPITATVSPGWTTREIPFRASMAP